MRSHSFAAVLLIFPQIKELIDIVSCDFVVLEIIVRAISQLVALFAIPLTGVKGIISFDFFNVHLRNDIDIWVLFYLFDRYFLLKWFVYIKCDSGYFLDVILDLTSNG